MQAQETLSIQEPAEVGIPSTLTDLAGKLQQQVNEQVEREKEQLLNKNQELTGTVAKLQIERKRYQPIIDLIESLDEESGGAVTIVYEEDNQVVLQALDIISTTLRDQYLVGAFSELDRTERIRLIVRFMVQFVTRNGYARELFTSFVADNPIDPNQY